MCVREINPPRKESNMEFMIVYMILTPFLCMMLATLFEIAAKKIKTALAKRAKAVPKHSCSVEKINFTDSKTRKAV